MEALVLERKDELSLRDIEIEEVLGPHDVRIRLHTVGICGSDVHYYTHGAIGQYVVREPMVLGHARSSSWHQVLLLLHRRGQSRSLIQRPRRHAQRYGLYRRKLRVFRRRPRRNS